MNKKLFTLVYILTLTLSYSVYAAITLPTSNTGAGSLTGLATTTTQTRPSADTISKESKSIFETLNPTTKKCNFVNKKLYQPFADIDKSFPGASSILKMDDNGCVSVAGATENIVKLLFTTGITVIIILTVVSISVSGIQYMTEEAVGKKGEAKKRLTNSFIALGLGLLSYTILYTINKQLVEFSFDPAGIDYTNAVNKGISDTNASASTTSGYYANIAGIEAMNQVSDLTNGIPTTGYNNPLLDTLSGSVQTGAYNSSYIQCSGVRCKSAQTTVFGFMDGDGKTGFKGDNGIGAPSLSDYNDCVIDNGHEQSLINPSLATRGIALPLNFFTRIGMSTTDARLAGIKLIYNDQAIGIYPVVDFSYAKLDLTFGLVKYVIGRYDTTASAITKGGGWDSDKYSFEIIRDYYKYTPKDGVQYGLANSASLGNTRPVGGLQPCPKARPKI